jgi:hypothetical protein
MKLNPQRLEANVREYLDSDESERVWQEFGNPVLFNVIGTVLGLIIGLVLVCTIYFAWTGLKLAGAALRSFLTLEVFRDQQLELRNHPERITPLITAGIIIGPRGHGLALGSFVPETQAELTFLGRKARELADLYREGSERDADQPMVDLMRDDTYRLHRRRQVPASHAEGRSLVMFDGEIDMDKAFAVDETVWIACVTTTNLNQEDATPPGGEIIQIPWSVPKSAVATAKGPPPLIPDLPSD